MTDGSTLDYNRDIENRLSAMELDEAGSASDARIQLGKAISDEIRERAIIGLTRTLLESRGLIHLLDRPALPGSNVVAAMVEGPQGASGSQSL